MTGRNVTRQCHIHEYIRRQDHIILFVPEIKNSWSTSPVFKNYFHYSKKVAKQQYGY